MSDRPALPQTFEGGCHCGNVRFRVTLHSWRMSHCNCSICTKKGYLHLIVNKEDLQLLGDPGQVTTYAFNTRQARHHFCSNCGIHSYYVPRSHPDGFSVNARCLDQVDPAWFERVEFDGLHWEEQIKNYR